MMKKLLFLLLGSLFLFANEADFFHDYNKAVEEARIQNKFVYLLITSQSCKWCRKFEKQTLSDESIIKALKENYILLHLDKDKDDMPQSYIKQRVPRHYFITSKGEVIYTFLGYWNVEDFNAFLYDIKTNSLPKFKGKQ